MKSLRLLIAIATTFMISFTAMSRDRIFSNYPDNNGISTVYISGAAIRLGLSMAGSDSDMNQIQKFVRNPEGIEIVSAETPEAIKIVKKGFSGIANKLNMELMLNATDDGEVVNIYTSGVSEDNVIHDILIETTEPDEYTLVYIRGEIDVNALQEQYNK